MNFRISGMGKYLPKRIVSNEELSTFVDTSDEWIARRVGIKERRVSTDEWTSDMAYHAACEALSDAGIQAESLDLIIAATISNETISPSLSCLLQKRLGASCPAFDINAACASFLFLLDTAAGFFARGKVSKVLVVGAERLSGLLDWSDRGTCIIFGDGAGAAVLETGDGYVDSTLTTVGNDEVIKIPTHIGSSPFFTREQTDAPFIHMNGQETFKYAVNAICKDIRLLLERNGLKQEDIAYVVPHQANRRIIDFAAKELKMPEEKMVVNIDKYGNTSSASVPIALCELKKDGKLKDGALVMLSAFGGGLSNGACLLRWQES